IDLHTAALGKSNLPHVRADMEEPAARRLAKAFGAEFVVAFPGRKSTLRRAATAAGVPTIAYEAGETFKFQRREVRKGIFGVYNVLAELGMLEIPVREPRFRVWSSAPAGCGRSAAVFSTWWCVQASCSTGGTRWGASPIPSDARWWRFARTARG